MSRARAPFWDPDGAKYGLPTYPWRMAPPALATYRQLQAAGLRPGGQDICAQIMWRSRRSRTGILVAYLYDIDAAKPKRTATPAQREAIERALAARRTCRNCGAQREYFIARRFGVCLDCLQDWEVAA